RQDRHLFLSEIRVHLDLRSFPTRRSSDLCWCYFHKNIKAVLFPEGYISERVTRFTVHINPVKRRYSAAKFNTRNQDIPVFRIVHFHSIRFRAYLIVNGITENGVPRKPKFLSGSIKTYFVPGAGDHKQSCPEKHCRYYF